MASSVRNAIVRAVLRGLIKPMGRPSVSLAVQRTLINGAGLTMRRPRGLVVENIALAGIAAQNLVPGDADATRHMLYLHGGAYVEGSPASHTLLAGQVAAAVRATTWLIDYRLAPEHPFPAALDDALAAYRELLANGADPQRFVIAGDSAGGGLTLAAALAIRDSGLPHPGALVMLSPWTDLTLSGASMRDKMDVEPMLNVEWLDWAAGLYAGNTIRTDPGLSPLFADLAGLPPMIVHVGSDEVLLDDATFLAKRAAVAGIDVTLREFEGMWHVFQAQAGFIAEADESLREIAAFIDKRLPR